MLTQRSIIRRRSCGRTGRSAPSARSIWRALSTLAVLLVTLAATGHHPQAQLGIPGVLETDRWMDTLFQEKPAALETTLGHFVFPGSHDAGTLL